ncbi:hypothetical protein SCP_0303990 [Sparassis crispa]|uniref:Uncharacterized protein n=1 Tax=Sparassis crispa TaxID=139825 RepID=A0A401GET9_9APHY|nr:hypothetical protein SCP_0303990 [Sparassis crispa]GBE80680.1 hypothetical protein SCP_0303990 [Sparassis crispa]
MSVSSYRLETPRPRPPPPPIRTHNFSAKSPTPSNRSREATRTLLYDVPSATTRRTASPSGIASPSSPFRSRARTRGMTPPPSTHRSITPSQPARSDFEEFAEHCRAWYYEQNDNAGRVMTQTLATLPPSQRAPFARLQASVRSAYHASVNARRNAEFKAHLSATKPGGSLMPHSRADPNGPLAKKERYERLERFVRTWCTMGMPGTKPFFQGLWAVMRLQVIPQALGGAGGLRIEWEIDDSVFKEAAGKDFMLDAIDVLKGVLGFEEAPTTNNSPSLTIPGPYSAFSPLSTIHSRSQSQPLPTDFSAPPNLQKVPPISSTTTTQPKRPRAPSDPFSDTPALSASYSSATTTRLSTSGSTLAEEPLTPTTPVDGEDVFAQAASVNTEFCDLDGHLRTWTAPDLRNPEYVNLLSVFPAFITQNTLPRFPITSGSQRPADIEEGEEMQEDSRRITIGTGTMWLGAKPRTTGWEGGWWTRFKLWLQRIFC